MNRNILQPPADREIPPQLGDYERERERFTWDLARAGLDGLPGGQGLNIAYEAVDRHALGRRCGHLALCCLARGGGRREFTYGRLRELSNRFADALLRLGVKRGERVFVLSERIPELYIAALGTLKAGCVFCPLFSAFGPEPIRARMNLGEARVLVTTPRLYERKVAPIRRELSSLRHVLLVVEQPEDGLPDGPDIHDFQALLDRASPDFQIEPTRPEDFALLHFTSGTTGKPKGVVHVHEAVVVHATSARFALDLREGDVFWCTADPGWVTGTSFGIIAPLVLGATLVVDREEFDPQRWYALLEQEKVNVWYTAPTAIRMMMRAGSEPLRGRRFPRLRHLCSVGEPLNPDAVVWGRDTFGIPFHDNWWQTETGGIMISNYPSMAIRPGSMGKPLPGIEAAIAHRDKDGHVDLIEEPDTDGELVLRAGWPSMFRAYLNEEERYRKCFSEGWYFTGDLARRDADGYYWFIGRADDVIKSSGHLIGPFEVESVLMEHPAVAGAGVIGKPDPVAGEIVKAFVELKPGAVEDEALRLDILGFARKRLGAVVAPKEIAYSRNLPRTRSGKIMRRLLKARELGLPEGDLSTLEPAA